MKNIFVSKILPIGELNSLLRKEMKDNPDSLHIAIPMIPIEMEPKHMLILGTAGSGKGYY